MTDGTTASTKETTTMNLNLDITFHGNFVNGDVIATVLILPTPNGWSIEAVGTDVMGNDVNVTLHGPTLEAARDNLMRRLARNLIDARLAAQTV